MNPPEISSAAAGLLSAVGATLADSPPQIGIVVADLDLAVAGAEALGVMGTFRAHAIAAADFSEIVHRGRPADLAFRFALNRASPQIEFIEPTAGESVYREFLDRGGSGLHHLGFTVADIAATTRKMAAAGFEPVFHGHGLGSREDGAFAYFDTSSILGYWLEAIEPPAPQQRSES